MDSEMQAALDAAIDRLEKKLTAMPCTQHLERVTRIEQSFIAIEKMCERLLNHLEGNGKTGLVVKVAILEKELGDLIHWQGEQREKTKEHDKFWRGLRWRVMLATFGWFLSLVGTFLAAKLL